MRTQQPVLDEDRLYIGDNGRIFCGKCAGYQAKYSGFDLSGAPVCPVTVSDRIYAGQLRLSVVCESCSRSCMK